MQKATNGSLLWYLIRTPILKMDKVHVMVNG